MSVVIIAVHAALNKIKLVDCFSINPFKFLLSMILCLPLPTVAVLTVVTQSKATWFAHQQQQQLHFVTTVTAFVILAIMWLLNDGFGGTPACIEGQYVELHATLTHTDSITCTH